MNNIEETIEVVAAAEVDEELDFEQVTLNEQLAFVNRC